MRSCKWIISVILPLSVTLLSAQAAHPPKRRCTDEEGRRALDHADTPRSWDALYKSYMMFGRCDDGAIGEGFSQSVARILVDHWSTLPRLTQLARQDGSFRAFVMRHVDATLNTDDIEKVKENSRMNCPTGLRTTCTNLAEQADSALKEASSR